MVRVAPPTRTPTHACRDLRSLRQDRRPPLECRYAKDSRRCSPSPGLRVPARLRATLTNTNCTESMISITRTTTGRAKNSKTGTMKKRRIAPGVLEAERSFRRAKGHAAMPAFAAALPPDPRTRHPHFQRSSGRLSKIGISTELKQGTRHPPSRAGHGNRSAPCSLGATITLACIVPIVSLASRSSATGFFRCPSGSYTKKTTAPQSGWAR
jgi:hypothetical protein